MARMFFHASRGVVVASVAFACAAPERLVVPPHLQRSAAQAEAEARSPYVVKLNDGGRQWEVSLPQVSGGYEVRIPIGDGSPLVPGVTPSSAPGTAPKSGAQDAPKTSATGRDNPASYFSDVAKVQALFERKSYQLALMEVAGLLDRYPADAQLFAMAGTLHLKLGDSQSAQKAWERALDLDPENEVVQQALEQLP